MASEAEYATTRSAMEISDWLQPHLLSNFFLTSDKAKHMLLEPPSDGKPPSEHAINYDKQFCTKTARFLVSEDMKVALLKQGVASKKRANDPWTDTAVDFVVSAGYSAEGKKMWFWTSQKGESGPGLDPANGSAPRHETDHFGDSSVNQLGLTKDTATILEKRVLPESEGGIPSCGPNASHDGISTAQSAAIERLLEYYSVLVEKEENVFIWQCGDKVRGTKFNCTVFRKSNGRKVLDDTVRWED